MSGTAATTAQIASDEHRLALRQRLLQVARIAVPTTGNMMILFLSQSITLFFVSRRLGPTVLAQLSVAVMTYNAFGLSIGLALVNAMETFASQAYGRDKHTKLFPCFLLRTAIILAGFYPAVWAVFVCSQPVLSAIFGETLGHGAAVYLRIAVLALPATWGTRAVNNILYAQHLSQFSFAANFVSFALTPLLGYLIIHDTIDTAAYMLIVREWLCFGLVFAVAMRHPVSLLPGGDWQLSRALIRPELLAQLRLGISCAIGACCEWWSYEALTFIAGQLGPTPVAAYAVLTTINLLVLSQGIGLCIGFTNVLGHLLGEGRGEDARWLIRRIYRASFLIGAEAFTVMALLSPLVFPLFTEDDGLLDALHQARWGMACMTGLSAAMNARIAIFRGSGQQLVQARAGLLALWGVGTPAAALLALVLRVGMVGVPLGQSAGLVVLCTLQWVFERRIDWDAMAAKAASKLHGEGHSNAAHPTEGEPRVAPDELIAAEDSVVEPTSTTAIEMEVLKSFEGHQL